MSERHVGVKRDCTSQVQCNVGCVLRCSQQSSMSIHLYESRWTTESTSQSRIALTISSLCLDVALVRTLGRVKSPPAIHELLRRHQVTRQANLLVRHLYLIVIFSIDRCSSHLESFSAYAAPMQVCASHDVPVERLMCF